VSSGITVKKHHQV